MKKELYFILLFINLYIYAFAQAPYKYNDKWLLGSDTNYPCRGYTILDFHNGNVVTNLVQQDSLEVEAEMDFFATSATISDSAGNIILYTNGKEVRNAVHLQMVEGDSLSEEVTIQGVLVLPKPNSPRQYYLFNQDYPNPYITDLKVSTINLDGANGWGSVYPKKVSVIHDTLGLGMITSCKHANGRDWWVLVPAIKNGLVSGYYRVLVTPDSILGPYYQKINPHNTQPSHTVFSPDGSKFICYEDNGNLATAYSLWLFDFDRCTGALSNEQIITTPIPFGGSGGVAVSPNSRVLYACTPIQIDQYDLFASDIAGTRVTVATVDTTAFVCGGTMHYYYFLGQIANDGKIYWGTAYTNTDALHVIDYPDSLGLACHVRPHGLKLFGTNLHVPNYPNYYLGALPTPCYATEITPKQQEISFSLSPNPASNELHFVFSSLDFEKAKISIQNIMGEEMYVTEISANLGNDYQLPIQQLAEGVYFCTLSTEKYKSVQKFVVLR
jgi:hypothetical protein